MFIIALVILPSALWGGFPPARCTRGAEPEWKPVPWPGILIWYIHFFARGEEGCGGQRARERTYIQLIHEQIENVPAGTATLTLLKRHAGLVLAHFIYLFF